MQSQSIGQVVSADDILPPTKTPLSPPSTSKLPPPIVHQKKQRGKIHYPNRQFTFRKQNSITLAPQRANYPKTTSIQSAPRPAGKPKTYPANIYKEFGSGNLVVFNRNDGIPSNSSVGLFEDRDGALWGCNRYDGIFKYDGMRFEHYLTPQGLLDYSVIDMLFDRDGDLWIGTSTGLQKFDGRHFTTLTGEGEVSQNKPTKLVEDSLRNIWIGSIDGLYMIDKSTESIHHFAESSGLIQNNISALLVDSLNRLWITYNNQGISLLSYNLKADGLHFAFDHYVDEARNLGMVQAVIQTNPGSILIGTERELIFIPVLSDYDDKMEGYYYSNESLEAGFIFDFANDHSGKTWIASDRLFKIDERSSRDQSHHIVVEIPEDTPDEAITAIIEDRSKNIWFSGPRVGHAKLKNDRRYQPVSKAFDIEGDIRQLTEDPRKDLWFYIPKRSLFCLPRGTHPGEEVLLEYPFTADGISNNYELQIDHSGDIWLNGATLLRLQIKDPMNGGLIYRYDLGHSVSGSFIQSILVDHEGDIWVAKNDLSLFDKVRRKTGGGVYHLKDDSIYTYGIDQGLLAPNIYSMTMDRQNQIWFNCLYYGISKFTPGGESGEDSWAQIADDQLTRSNIFPFLVDPISGVLIPGQTGYTRLSSVPEFPQIKIDYPLGDDIDSDFLSNMVRDSSGRIWVCDRTGPTIYRIERDVQTQIPIYIKASEVVGLPYAMGTSMLKSDDDLIWAGVDSQLISFKPSDVIRPVEPKHILLRQMMIDDEVVDLSSADPLALTHDKNDIEFEFHSIDINEPDKVEYRYFVDGHESEWNAPTQVSRASYHKLPHGQYTFKVAARAQSNPWGTTLEFPFRIYPPWWKSWWAYTLYAIGLITAFILAWRLQTRRLKEKNEIEKQILEAAKVRELNEAKTEFFTNVSHEFRTPLTVIHGMTEELDESIPAKRLIKQSSDNLLKLVNQLLDFSKLEAGKLSVDAQPGELVEYLSYLMQSFQTMAQHKQIQLRFISKIKRVYFDFDESKIQHIVSNLISNAIKFTNSGGLVELKLKHQNDHIMIQVIDNGIGIPPEKLPHVFERFYQIQNEVSQGAPGTGIGLSFSKELVELLDGTITVESQKGEGSQFTVELPLKNVTSIEYEQEGLIIEPIQHGTAHIVNKDAAQDLNGETDEPSGLPNLLVIDDNPEIIAYIRNILSEDFDIDMAEDGEQGIQKAIELIPDIIISDVMMPFKDGYQVVDTLKNDTRTSHIPIILLTAMADQTSRIEGLSRGADAYLAKPFNKTELRIRLTKMVELRRTLQSRYAKGIQIENTDVVDAGLLIEDAFITQVNALIESHLDDIHFSVDELSKAVGMSRSQLYRKLKALTDQSSVAYLRTYRLHKAKSLLEQRRGNVSEIAYSVGFSDPSYFSKAFSKEFGIAPKDLMKSGNAPS